MSDETYVVNVEAAIFHGDMWLMILRSAEEAIARVRAVCPGAICAPIQEDALRAFTQRKDWIV